ncbi:MAG: nucleotide exchange factor GrpE, partial [Thermoanaerobaculia bacterium]|nr:nucleotide exchange factor GrpE [Thermoanaerobaculia bacterium]
GPTTVPRCAASKSSNAEVTGLRERQARTLADFDNFRKRSERDRESALRYALFGPLRDMLEVLDNLERAIGAQGSAEDLKLGVQMTLRQFQALLERHAVSAVAAVGQPFDPKIHEAVSRQESDTVTAPTVIAEFQKGYLLHDRLLRPAMVTVAMPAVAMPAAEAPAPAQTSPAEESVAEAEAEAGSAETAD